MTDFVQGSGHEWTEEVWETIVIHEQPFSVKKYHQRADS